MAKLARVDPALATATNPGSLYIRNVFEVFACNFLVGLAIVCQPHILGKSFLLKDAGQVKAYLAVAILSGLVFVSVMIVGLYARLTLPQLTAVDRVVPSYIALNFSSGAQILIGIGLLCAGISTLEGLLLALSTILSNDIYLAFRPAQPENQEGEWKRALLFGKASMVLVGAACILLSIRQIQNPTGGSVAIFGQYGVYLLFTTTSLPIACGLFIPQATKGIVAAGGIASTVLYFGAALGKAAFPASALFGLCNNPAVLATFGILGGWVVVALGLLRIARSRAKPISCGQTN
jgi:Na+/pantothenate symporter